MLNIKLRKADRTIVSPVTSAISLVRKVVSVSSIAIITLSPLSLNIANAAGDIEKGHELSQTCLGCHGAPGLRNPGPVYSIPMLGGQSAEYIITALKAYKNKTRPHATMQAQSASLSDQDMQDIAAYFSQINGTSRDVVVNKQKAAAGKELTAVCATCHGTDGATTTSAEFPKLAGQYESYLIHALKEYRSGDRQSPVMGIYASSLTIKQIEALSAWYASQNKGGLVAPKTDIFKFD